MEPGSFTHSFTCAVCQREHAELPHLGFDVPVPYARLPEAERDRRATLTSDTCVVDGEHYFIRGVIELPVHDYPETFGFNGWVSQSRASFEAYVSRPTAEDLAPTYGYLSTELTCYPVSTLLLKIRVHFRGGGLRPYFELEPTDHPLAVDQRTGISLRRACELWHHYDVELDPVASARDVAER